MIPNYIAKYFFFSIVTSTRAQKRSWMSFPSNTLQVHNSFPFIVDVKFDVNRHFTIKYRIQRWIIINIRMTQEISKETLTLHCITSRPRLHKRINLSFLVSLLRTNETEFRTILNELQTQTPRLSTPHTYKVTLHFILRAEPPLVHKYFFEAWTVSVVE